MDKMTTITRSATIGVATGLITGAIALALIAIEGHENSLIVLLVLGVAIGITLLHHWKAAVIKNQASAFAGLNQRLNRLADQIAETQGLVQLTPFERPYPMPFGGGWALTADAAAVLAREVALKRPQTIVELGSGVSSVLVGRMLKEAGRGKLYSLDHDSGWAEHTRRHIRASGVEEHVQVLDAALSRQRFGEKDFEWYTVPDAVRQLGAIDLLVIDGPPQRLDTEGTPRYPALPAFISQLAPDALVYVDDAKRPQEQAMIKRWLQEYPEFEHFMLDTVPGTCLLRRKA